MLLSYSVFNLQMQQEVPRFQSNHDLFNYFSPVRFVWQMIMERKFQPVIVFSFSRRECEQYATAMAKLDFNTDEEKEAVEDIFKKAVEVLNEEDRSLPAIDLLLPLLKRGIGVHHSGLLPILKEVVELMFQEGLCKALFATETVSVSLATCH